MRDSKQLFGNMVLSACGFVALITTGCATSTIASRHPHLERRAVCVRVPGIENDAADYIITGDGAPVSGLHSEVVDREAPKIRTVYEFSPSADPSSIRYLPAQFQHLECAPVFTMLPSIDAETAPLPEAAVDVLVHERRPERLPLVVAKQLATCPSPAVGEVPPMGFSLNFNVYVDPDGDADAALMRNSTLGDRKTEECFVNVLRTTSWSVPAIREPELAAVSVGSKLFLADGPMQAPNLTELLREVTKVVPKPPPAGFPLPFVGAFSLGAVLAGGTVFIGIQLLPRETAPRWIDELNPITKRPYLSAEEFEAIQKLTAEELKQALIKASQPRVPPAAKPQLEQPPPADPPPPPPPPRREKPDKCPKIKQWIYDQINAKRDDTEGDYPSGYQGLKKRWEEYATNKGKWGYTKEGDLGRKPKNHIGEYRKEQKRLVDKLENEWENNQCEAKGYTLPDNARQYAVQEPQLGPGKPLGPAPTPILPRPSSPVVNVPQVNKPSK